MKRQTEEHPNGRATRRWPTIVVALAFSVAMTACGDDNSSPTAPSSINTPTAQAADSGDRFPDAAPPNATRGSSERRTAVNSDTSTTVPGPVTGFTAVQISGHNAVRMSWSAPTTGGAATSYTTTRGSYDRRTIDASTCTTTCEAVYDALSHDPHAFSVYASNQAGNGETSTITVTVSATTANSNPPGAVTGLSATQAAGNEDVTVSWTEPAETTTAGGAATYRVEASNTNWYNVESTNCSWTGCAYTLTNLTAGNHTITVIPSNAAGTGTGTSVAITVVDRSAQAPPGPVTNLTATQVGDTNAAEITWSAPTTGGPVTSYSITRSGGTAQTVTTSSCNPGCSYTEDSLLFGVHMWTIEAIGPSGRSTAAVSVNVDQAFTAELSRAPSNHGGSRFTVRLSFSENTNLSPRTLRNSALEVTNGRVRRAKRVTPRAFSSRNREWNIQIRPIDDELPVTITVPVRQCAQTGALCTDDDRQLETGATATVQP